MGWDVAMMEFVSANLMHMSNGNILISYDTHLFLIEMEMTFTQNVYDPETQTHCNSQCCNVKKEIKEIQKRFVY